MLLFSNWKWPITGGGRKVWSAAGMPPISRMLISWFRPSSFTNFINTTAVVKPIRAKDLLPVIVANPHPVYRSWGLLYVEARDGDSLESIAKEFGFSVKKLAKYNEVPKDYPLEAGDIVYLEKKKKKAEKGYDYCIVRSGDSMHTIAQRYGIRLKNLYKMNKLPDDYTPSVGDTLRLR